MLWVLIIGISKRISRPCATGILFYCLLPPTPFMNVHCGPCFRLLRQTLQAPTAQCTCPNSCSSPLSERKVSMLSYQFSAMNHCLKALYSILLPSMSDYTYTYRSSYATTMATTYFMSLHEIFRLSASTHFRAASSHTALLLLELAPLVLARDTETRRTTERRHALLKIFSRLGEL